MKRDNRYHLKDVMNSYRVDADDLRSSLAQTLRFVISKMAARRNTTPPISDFAST